MRVKFVIFSILTMSSVGLTVTLEKSFFSEEKHFDILEKAFRLYGEATGRSDVGGLERFRSSLEKKVARSVSKLGWVSARLLSRALSVDMDWSNLNTSLVKVQGHVTACHASPVCLDLACGKCFDPLTSIHGDCGELSYFKCENLLPEVCLPWTCAKTSASLNKPLLRNFLPRSSGCRSEESLTLVTDTDLAAPVELVGLGLTLTALTACSEEPVCWDEDCLLCYDPLEQHHAPCPASLTVHSCGHLPLPCQPFLCWPRQHNTSQLTTVLLRDFRRSLNSC